MRLPDLIVAWGLRLCNTPEVLTELSAVELHWGCVIRFSWERRMCEKEQTSMRCPFQIWQCYRSAMLNLRHLLLGQKKRRIIVKLSINLITPSQFNYVFTWYIQQTKITEATDSIQHAHITANPHKLLSINTSEHFLLWFTDFLACLISTECSLLWCHHAKRNE